MLNDDGYSVKGCDIIYAPRGQAGEYAKLAVNHYRGCGHQCVYCYVPAAIRMARADFDADAAPRKDVLVRLRKDAEKYQAHGITEQVMLSFTTDPYNPTEVGAAGRSPRLLTRDVLKTLHEYGMGFCTLTKGGQWALRDIDLFESARDAFASTLTTLDPEQSREWEPQAALPRDRMGALKLFHEAGVFTWVSLEPVYDTEMTLSLIKETSAYVDLYKIGRINYHRITREIDWGAFAARVLRVVNDLGKKHYIKHDLQPYLPKGYSNPKYIPQNL